MSELLQLQQTFAMLLANLIEHAYAGGLALTVGEAWRTPEQAQWNAEHGTGIAHSLHTERLAIDLNLFRGEALLTSASDYEPLGVYWESLHEQARWGGRFTRPDADHFSLTFNGVS